MGAATGVEPARDGARVPWGDVLMSALAAVSWALIGMAGTAALGLRLLEADAAGSLGPMTAAVVALAAGGSVTPSGDVSAFGLTGAEADTAIEITPLGVSLVGALLLSWFFLRSLRAAGVVIAPAELLARAGAVVALSVAMLGGLVWAGHDVITIDGGSLGLDDVPGGSGSVEVPGLGDIGGLLPDRLGELVDARAAVGFTVDTAPTLLGGLGWTAGVLVIALLASRRTPLPPGWEAVHRVVRPAVSALVTVLVVAVAAGLAAAAYAAIGDDHPRRVAGAALLGAPNGVWLGVPLGLFVPWDGRATGELTRFLPDPLDDLLGSGTDRPVTLGRLAELDGRVWLLGVAAALMMLLAGVLTAVRTPVVGGAGTGSPGAPPVSSGPTSPNSGAPSATSGAASPGSDARAFVGRCALRLGAVTALGLPLLAWLTDVSVSASLSVLGIDAFGAGIDLHGHVGTALLLGAVWGAGAGGAGALLAWGFGVAGRSATALARGVRGSARGEGDGSGSGAEWGSGPGARLAAWPGAGPAAEPGATATSPAGPGPAGYGDGAGAGGGERRAGWSGPRAGAAPRGHLEGVQDLGPEAAQPGAGWVGPGGHSPPPGHREDAQDLGPEAAQPGARWSGPRAGAAPQGHREGAQGLGAETGEAGAGWVGPGGRATPHGHDAGRLGGPGPGVHGEEAGPYAPGTPYRPPNPATNPYLRVPDGQREPEDARPQDSPPQEDPDGRRNDPAGPEDDSAAPEDDGIYGAPTVVRPVGPPPRGPRQSPGPRNGNGPPARPDEWPPPPPPPPPPPRTPRGG
ncbi:streptophobe family protein [Streptomyces sp. NPDC057837]|uniref:streptophobe family protein n=1 Tax=Streptomyces sp. NPDC057837 TaxID=3346260 RepID=UPI0036C62F45